MSKIQRRSAVINSLMEEDDQNVTNLIEDVIVAEILPRLHVKLLFRFKCVSKRYESIISNPRFARSYMQRAYSSPKSLSSSGLHTTLLFPFTDLSPFQGHCFSKNVKDLSNDNQNPLRFSINRISLPYKGLHKIVASSNGLVLSLFHPDGYHHMNTVSTLCVSNPFTKQCVKLPRYLGPVGLNYRFGIATRRDQATNFLTYKIVTISYYPPRVKPHDYRTANIMIFSSDNGSWDFRNVTRPKEVSGIDCGGCLSHNGILYWLDHYTMTLFTYDPYDNPNRLGQIKLPESNFDKSSLIYSGEKEMLKYCETDGYGCRPNVDILTVWRLVNGSEWCLEGKYMVPSLDDDMVDSLIVAPDPWNRDVICYPFVNLGNQIAVTNTRTATWNLVGVFNKYHSTFYGSPLDSSPFIFVELCPWSSPFYA